LFSEGKLCPPGVLTALADESFKAISHECDVRERGSLLARLPKLSRSVIDTLDNTVDSSRSAVAICLTKLVIAVRKVESPCSTPWLRRGLASLDMTK